MFFSEIMVYYKRMLDLKCEIPASNKAGEKYKYTRFIYIKTFYMNVTGIIAEYNPFHLGHQYQMLQAKKRTNADYIIIVMSGSFVQRGACAITDKYTRAKAALCCGADLVLELPSIYAVGSAEYFAKGSVSLLNALGVVTHLSFGGESDVLEDYVKIAHFLNNEPQDYKKLLKAHLAQGFSYPKARFLALKKCYPDTSDLLADNSPNTILGIEYCRRLLELDSPIIPSIIKRCGSNYHSLELNSFYSSASAIRHWLSEQFPAAGHRLSEQISTAGHRLSEQISVASVFNEIFRQLPECSADSLDDAFGRSFPIFDEDLSSSLRMALFRVKDYDYTPFLDVTEDVSNRIRKHLYEFVSFQQFASLLKTKELTYTRICRCLIHILLGITDDLSNDGKLVNHVPYYRILGMRQTAAPLLRAIREKSSIPIITNPANVLRHLNQQNSLSVSAKHILKNDVFATNLYNCICADKFRTKTECELTRPFLKI